MSMRPRLILASASPRRRELLALLGLPFVVMPSLYLEPDAPNRAIPLGDFVTELATNKALEVAARIDMACAINQDREATAGTDTVYVIGADTLVTVDSGDYGVPLGKPADPEDACQMLRQLSGRTHQVFTGVAIVPVSNSGPAPEAVRTVVRTRVTFRDLSDTMIQDYVATGEPLDKAGAYGAQGYAAPFITGFYGDFYNVVGLPICTVATLLEGLGVEWWRHREHMPSVMG